MKKRKTIFPKGILHISFIAKIWYEIKLKDQKNKIFQLSLSIFIGLFNNFFTYFFNLEKKQNIVR